jgi:hypothetical protein
MTLPTCSASWRVNVGAIRAIYRPELTSIIQNSQSRKSWPKPYRTSLGFVRMIVLFQLPKIIRSSYTLV